MTDPTSPTGPSAATAADGIAEQDRTIARLEQDLSALRKLLVDYMSAREVTEDELRASEARYRSLIHRAAYGIFRATLDGQFIEANPALVQTLGYPDAAALLAADPSAVYYDPGDQGRLVSASLRGEHRGWTEVKWRRHDGAPVLIRLTLQIVRGVNNDAVALEGMTEDVTDRARQEELIRRSERMASLGHMLAGVAHELNNPLAAIGGFAQLLLRQALSEDDRSAIETINHESQRAAKIVRDLLAFSRRHERERRERVDLNEVVRYILDSQRYQIETQGIRRELALAAGLPRVLAQASQLEQVVLNLVVNARQALEESMDERMTARRGGQTVTPPILNIRTTVASGTVTLEVADNGPGIPAEHRARIWDPFWTTKEEGEGTGLGLAVVHGIVSTYGGTIDVETEVGVGTRFVVKFPAAPPMDDASESDSEADESIGHTWGGTTADRGLTGDPAHDGEADGRLTEAPTRVAGERHVPRRRSGPAAVKLRILVVDDETAMLELVARYFTARGHVVITTPDGVRAIEIARAQSFDVVICDLRMPTLDGTEVIRQLADLPTCRLARYIVSTGDRTALPDDYQVGAPATTTILEKPYDIEELRRAVEGAASPHAS